MLRQIALDTETTGLEPRAGHRIIEIAAIELLNRRPTGRQLHFYINPEREIEAGAQKVHGLTSDFLKNKPLFGSIADELIDFLKASELIIHNAPFDLGFLNAEFKKVKKTWSNITEYCSIIDTLEIARRLHPGQRNNLDALCKRYGVDNKHRQLHGALIDADLLSRVYLMMTAGQENLFVEEEASNTTELGSDLVPLQTMQQYVLPVIYADEVELAAHQAFMESVLKK